MDIASGRLLITGQYVSDGDPSVHGLLGTRSPNLRDSRRRWFYTQQRGDNPTYEVVPVQRLASSHEH